MLDEEIDITDENANKEIKAKDGSIIFKNVSFKYDINSHEKNLDNINIEIKSGETVGIIGGTGSAKTTLVQLIPRLYDVTEGSIIVGGHDVREYDLKYLRDMVGMVLQNNVLFSGTIKENLKWGNEHATDEEIIRACKAAQAHEFITSFPNGYETVLGQGGVNVSGGRNSVFVLQGQCLKDQRF